MIWMPNLLQKSGFFVIFRFRMGSFSQLLNNMDLPTALSFTGLQSNWYNPVLTLMFNFLKGRLIFVRLCLLAATLALVAIGIATIYSVGNPAEPGPASQTGDLWPIAGKNSSSLPALLWLPS